MSPQSPSEITLLNTADVARLCGVSESTIKRWTADGLLPCVRTAGGHRRFQAGDLRRFHHHRQFLKFCGLDLSTQQSGQYRGQTRLSKFGNARLRRTLWIAGQVAIRQRENGFRHKFERCIARDRDNPDLRRKAMTAITAKMARVVHAVVKGGCDYRPFVEGRVPGGRTSVR